MDNSQKPEQDNDKGFLIMALSTITDLVYSFDRDGRFLYANQPLLDIWGLKAEDAIGKTMAELDYPAEIEKKLLADINLVFDTKQSLRGETPYYNDNGIDGYFEYIFNPQFASDGTVELIYGSTRDISDRKQTEEKLRRSEERLRMATEAARIFNWEIDLNLNAEKVVWGANAEEFLGFPRNSLSEDLSRIYDFIHPEDLARANQVFETTIQNGEPLCLEHRMVNPESGETIWIWMEGMLIRDAKRNTARIVGISQNITERKQREDLLRQSEEPLRLLIESAKDYAIITKNNAGEIDSWNTGAERLYGYTEAEIVGKHFKVLFTPEDRAARIPEREMKIVLEKGFSEDERWHLRKDGSRFYASGIIRQLRDESGNLLGFVKICRDMTDKIKAQEDLRHAHESLEIKVRERTSQLAEVNESLQAEISERKRSEARRVKLLRQLVTTQENERQRVSRELHDHLGQQLTALRLNLESLSEDCLKYEDLCEKITRVKTIAKRLDANVDFLAWELRPAAIEDLGLLTAIKNYVKEWSLQFNIPAEFHTTGLDKAEFPLEVEVNLYRITQEALNNTCKYASAKQTNVLLERRDTNITLIIEDDGVGFDVKKATTLKNGKGLGLIGMRERAVLVGGKFEIESECGIGTTIFVRVPLVSELSATSGQF